MDIEKEDIFKVLNECSKYFREQENRENDDDSVLFKIVEVCNMITGVEEKDHDLFFITRASANEYKEKHSQEFEGELKIKAIKNNDSLLKKIIEILKEY